MDIARMTAEDLKRITKSDLYAIFVDTIIKCSDDRLDGFTKSEVIDEDTEKVVGKLKLVYSYMDRGYLTFVVTFVNQDTMKVMCVEKGEVVAEFNRNPETGGWSGIEATELDGVPAASMSDVISKVVNRLKKVLV